MPDASYVYGLYRLRESEGPELTLRNRIKFTRLLCDMENAVVIPPQYKAITKEIRTPFMRDTWLRVTAALTRDTPVMHVEPKDAKNADSRAAANIGESWTWAAFQQMNKDQSDDMIYESTKALVRDEESVLKVVYRPDAWANFPVRGPKESATDFTKRTESYKKQFDTRLPYAWRVVDRLSMLFGDGEFGDDWALEYGEYPLPYLANRYGMQETTKDGSRRLIDPQNMLGGMPEPEGYLRSSGAGFCTKIEYWDAAWWHVVIDGQNAPGFPKRNPYNGRLPYIRAKSDPVLFALSFLVPGLDALLTMKLNWSYLGAYPSPKITTLPNAQGAPALDIPGGDDGDATADQDAVLRWKPGIAIDLPVGKDMTFLVPPPVGQDLNEMITIVRGLIDVAGVPSVFRGIGGADQAGYAINQLIAAANLTYKKLGESLERQFAQAGEFLWYCVANRIKDDVYVRGDVDVVDPTTGATKKDKAWLGLKPDGKLQAQVAPVTELGPLSVRFRPVLPTDEQARAMIGIQLVNAPKALMSRRRAIEKYLQEENPEQILDEIAIENAMDEEPLKSQWVQEAMREAGMVPEPQQNPAAGLVGPNGQPLLPQTPPSPFAPGQAGSGQPSVPGLNTPIQPGRPQTPGIAPGRGAGGFPGQPGGNLPRGMGA